MEYICVGKIVQTHGIKGELRIRSNFLKKIGKKVQKKATLAATCMVHEALWGEEPKGKGRGYGKKK